MANEIQIGGDLFTVEPLPAMRAFALQPRVAPIILELLTAAVPEARARLKVGADGGVDVDKMLDSVEVTVGSVLSFVEAIAPVLASVMAKLSSHDLESVTRELLYATTRNGQLLFTPQGNPFDVAMRGRSLDVWRLLGFALRVNYPDFFGGLGALASRVRAAPSDKSST